VLDVVIAFLLVVLAFAVAGLTEGKVTKHAEEASFRVYRIVIHGILAMLIAFFLLGDQIIWIQCLTGFAWRAWLLLYVLPAWFTLVQDGAFVGGPNSSRQ